MLAPRSFALPAVLLASLATAAAVLPGCGAPAGSDGASASSEGQAITSIPTTASRDQNTASDKETNNCWLYATTGWVESLELAAETKNNVLVFDVEHLSVAYYDYWDWYSQITTGTTNSGGTLDPDGLDGGGEWGDVADMMLARGLVRDTEFAVSVDGRSSEADLVYKATQAMSKSLTSGALKSASARKNGVTVRSELDRAFGLSATVTGWMTAAFGADGSQTLATGSTPPAPLRSTDAVNVLVPHTDGTSEVRPLTDALGTNAGMSGADGTPDSNLRTGMYAWQDAPFTKGSDSDNRAYFIRVQKALNAGVPVPFGWFWAENSDPDGVGLFKGRPTGTTNSDDSTGHYTLAVDYQASNVPGFGKLAAGTPASDAAKSAALSPSASVDFFRVKDSEPYVHSIAGLGYSELYMTYLLSSDKVYERDTKKTVTEKSMMENTILPAGF